MFYRELIVISLIYFNIIEVDSRNFKSPLKNQMKNIRNHCSVYAANKTGILTDIKNTTECVIYFTRYCDYYEYNEVFKNKCFLRNNVNIVNYFETRNNCINKNSNNMVIAILLSLVGYILLALMFK